MYFPTEQRFTLLNVTFKSHIQNLPVFSIYSTKLKVWLEASEPLRAVALLKSPSSVSLLGGGQRMHFCRRFPMKSWRPTRAKTASANTVRIMTSTIFFTDWIRAPTMVFRPGDTAGVRRYSDDTQTMHRGPRTSGYPVGPGAGPLITF